MSEEIIDFADFFFKFTPYEYQKNFLLKCVSNNRIAGKWCRQSGKSTSVAMYTLYKALTGKIVTIIVAPTQSQASELFKKIRETLRQHETLNTLLIKDSATEMMLENGSRIIALPSGPEGRTIRGYTADIVIIEEAGEMKDFIVNSVIMPMISSKGKLGQVIKIGTPLLKNHFYKSCIDKEGNWSVVNVNWRDSVAAGQHTLEFIEEQRHNMTDIEFKCEWEAEFIDDKNSFFPTALVNKCIDEDLRMLTIY